MPLAGRAARRQGGDFGILPRIALMAAEGLGGGFDDLARLAKAGDAAVLQQRCMADPAQQIEPMRHHHHNGAPRTGGFDGRGQRLFAFGVEIGIGLIQHDQLAIAKEGARQTDALALPCREIAAARAHLGVIAAGQRQDQLVHAGAFGRGHHIRRFGAGVHHGDVFGNGAAKQFDLLGQKPDVAADLFRVPIGERGIINAHMPPHQGLQPHQRARQCGLARPGRPDQPQRMAGLQGQGDVHQQRILATGQHHGGALDRQPAIRVRQLHPRAFGFGMGQEQIEPGDGAARLEQGTPARDGLLHRGCRPPQQDGRGNHQPRCQLVVDDQNHPHAQHGDLQPHAGGLGQ